MKKPLTSIIIVTYNRKKIVLSCLKSLSKINYKNTETIVVDNASTDNTVASIKNKYPKIKIINSKINLGAVGGRNLGIKKAKGSYLLFVDDDNYVKPNFLDELIDLAISDAKIGFVGPKMYYYKDKKRIWFAGVKINLFTSKTTYLGINKIDKGQFNDIKETDQIPNVWLVNKAVIKKVGVMDNLYVMSYGESDWPMRAHMAGYKILFCPKAIVYHDIPIPKDTKDNIMTRGNPYRSYYFARNRIIFMKKFSSPFAFLFFILLFNNYFLAGYLYTFLKYKQISSIKMYLKGYFDGLLISFTNQIKAYNEHSLNIPMD